MKTKTSKMVHEDVKLVDLKKQEKYIHKRNCLANIAKSKVYKV